MMLDPETAIEAGVVGLAAGALVRGWTFRRQIEKDFVAREDFERELQARNDHCASCDRSLRETVTKETLELRLKPVLDEQEHRRRSMETLGEAMARSERRTRRMELTVERIAAKLGVPSPAEHETDEG